MAAAAAVASQPAPLPFERSAVPPPHAPDPTPATYGGGSGGSGSSVLASLAPKSSAATIAMAKKLGVRPFVDIDENGRKVPDYSTAAGRAAASSASASSGSGGSSSSGAAYGPQLPPGMSGGRRPLTSIRVGPAATRAPPSMMSARFTGAFSLGSASRDLNAGLSTADMFYGVDPIVARARAMAMRHASAARDDSDTGSGSGGTGAGGSSDSAADEPRRPPPLKRPTSISVDLKGCKNPMEAAKGAQPKPPQQLAAADTAVSPSSASPSASSASSTGAAGSPAGTGAAAKPSNADAAAIAAAAAEDDNAPKAENVSFMDFL